MKRSRRQSGTAKLRNRILKFAKRINLPNALRLESPALRRFVTSHGRLLAIAGVMAAVMIAGVATFASGGSVKNKKTPPARNIQFNVYVNTVDKNIDDSVNSRADAINKHAEYVVYGCFPPNADPKYTDKNGTTKIYTEDGTNYVKCSSNSYTPSIVTVGLTKAPKGYKVVGGVSQVASPTDSDHRTQSVTYSFVKEGDGKKSGDKKDDGKKLTDRQKCLNQMGMKWDGKKCIKDKNPGGKNSGGGNGGAQAPSTGGSSAGGGGNVDTGPSAAEIAAQEKAEAKQKCGKQEFMKWDGGKCVKDDKKIDKAKSQCQKLDFTKWDTKALKCVKDKEALEKAKQKCEKQDLMKWDGKDQKCVKDKDKIELEKAKKECQKRGDAWKWDPEKKKCVKRTGGGVNQAAVSGSIEVIVFNDPNGNRLKESSETGIAHVDVDFQKDGPSTQSVEHASTGLEGKVKILDVSGTYTVRIAVPEGYSAVGPTEQQVVVTEPNQAISFAVKQDSKDDALASPRPTTSPNVQLANDPSDSADAPVSTPTGPLASVPVVNELPKTGQFGLLGVLTAALVAGLYYGRRYLKYRRQRSQT